METMIKESKNSKYIPGNLYSMQRNIPIWAEKEKFRGSQKIIPIGRIKEGHPFIILEIYSFTHNEIKEISLRICQDNSIGWIDDFTLSDGSYCFDTIKPWKP